MPITTNFNAADLHFAFIDGFDKFPTFDGLAQQYADVWIEMWEENPEEQADDCHDLEGRAHDNAREQVIDDFVSEYVNVEFFIIVYSHEVLHRRPHDPCGADTALQIAQRNIEEIVRSEAQELINDYINSNK